MPSLSALRQPVRLARASNAAVEDLVFGALCRAITSQCQCPLCASFGHGSPCLEHSFTSQRAGTHLPIRPTLSSLLLFTQSSEHQSRVPVSAAGPHYGRDPDRLHQFLWSCPTAQCRLCVALDTPRGLRYADGALPAKTKQIIAVAVAHEDGFVKRVKSRVLIRR